MTPSDVLEEIEDADSAFMSAITPKEINGVKLEPFSLMRQAIALEIQGLNTETAFFEAVIRVWICTLPPLECIKAKRNKDQAQIDAFDWAEKQGFKENRKPLFDLYERINAELRHSTNAEPENEGETPAPNSGGLPA
jgi:hypothetical protein